MLIEKSVIVVRFVEVKEHSVSISVGRISVTTQLMTALLIASYFCTFVKLLV